MKEDPFLIIDSAIREDRSFAIRHVPGEDKFRFTVADNNSVFIYGGTDQLNGQQGFVIAPFCADEETPLVFLRAQEYDLPIPDTHFPEPSQVFAPSHITTGYPKRFRRFITPLREGWMDRLVLSRRVAVEKPVDFSPAMVFLKACRRYTRSYIYLYHTPYTGTWLGSTPNIFITGDAQGWQTAAIAGTQPMVGDKLPVAWNELQFEEQQMVSDHIYDRLCSAGLEPKVTAPYAIDAGGNISHLKTDFFFSLPDNDYIGDLLKLLYPMPSICGVPSEDAYQFILDKEGYNRRYYSGFLGKLDPQGKSEVYLNLRCMEVLEDQLALYVGSGLSPFSSTAEEWRDTEIKLATMKSLIYN